MFLFYNEFKAMMLKKREQKYKYKMQTQIGLQFAAECTYPQYRILSENYCIFLTIRHSGP